MADSLDYIDRGEEKSWGAMAALQMIKPAETVIYHEGVCLESCPQNIIKLVKLLHEDGKVTLLQRRIKKPMYQGNIDWVNGLGRFEYLAVGRHTATR